MYPGANRTDPGSGIGIQVDAGFSNRCRSFHRFALVLIIAGFASGRGFQLAYFAVRKHPMRKLRNYFSPTPKRNRKSGPRCWLYSTKWRIRKRAVPSFSREMEGIAGRASELVTKMTERGERGQSLVVYLWCLMAKWFPASDSLRMQFWFMQLIPWLHEWLWFLRVVVVVWSEKLYVQITDQNSILHQRPHHRAVGNGCASSFKYPFVCPVLVAFSHNAIKRGDGGGMRWDFLSLLSYPIVCVCAIWLWQTSNYEARYNRGTCLIEQFRSGGTAIKVNRTISIHQTARFRKVCFTVISATVWKAANAD